MSNIRKRDTFLKEKKNYLAWSCSAFCLSCSRAAWVFRYMIIGVSLLVYGSTSSFPVTCIRKKALLIKITTDKMTGGKRISFCQHSGYVETKLM
jgi:hypothetical protein